MQFSSESLLSTEDEHTEMFTSTNIVNLIPES